MPSYLKGQIADSTISVRYSSAQFIPDDQQLQDLFHFIDSNKFISVQLISHTDTVGSTEANIYLSQKRSRWIQVLLIDKYPFLPPIGIKDSGEIFPKSKVDNAINRRVDIHFKFTSLPLSNKASQIKIIKHYILDKLYFEPDLPIITASSLPYLDLIASQLTPYFHDSIEISGNVNWNIPDVKKSGAGYRNKMMELSIARAKAVYGMLIERGIPPARLRYIGRSNENMIYTDATTVTEKRQNMRVDIYIFRKGN